MVGFEPTKIGAIGPTLLWKCCTNWKVVGSNLKNFTKNWLCRNQNVPPLQHFSIKRDSVLSVITKKLLANEKVKFDSVHPVWWNSQKLEIRMALKNFF